jgi:hypothetical protein
MSTSAPDNFRARLLNSAYAAWGYGLRSATRLHGTPLWHRQLRINSTSVVLTDLISRLPTQHALRGAAGMTNPSLCSFRQS